MTELDYACRAMLSVVLATAATSKLGGMRPFAEFARSLRELGTPAMFATAAVAAIVIASEAMTAALLLAAPTLGYGLACGLLGAFTIGIASALVSDRRVACRCFGAATTPIGRTHLARNLILLSGAIAGAAGRWTSTAAAVPDSGWLCVVVGIIAGAAITRWDDLAYLFGSSEAVLRHNSIRAVRGPGSRPTMAGSAQNPAGSRRARSSAS